MNLFGGPWGLACNAIHFIDLVSWIKDENLIHIDTTGLNTEWHPAKRKGFWEVFGSLKATFSRGSEVNLHSEKQGLPEYIYELEGSFGSCKIEEEKNSAILNENIIIPGKLPYQSELTSILLEDILDRKVCNLPTIHESVQMHEILIGALLSHWKQYSDLNTLNVPVT